jgi:predicted DNA-binding transcriptional regulator AlpA
MTAPRLRHDLAAGEARSAGRGYIADDRSPVPARLVSRRQLAEWLGVSERTIVRWEESGHLPPPVRVGPRRVGHWEGTVPRQP